MSARVRLDGSAQPLQLARRWAAGGNLESISEPEVCGPVSSWEELDWQQALEQFRPILSYNELGTMFSSRAAALYDALSAILGLEEFDAVQATLRSERLAREKTGKEERQVRKELAATLEDSADPRALIAKKLLAPRQPNLDAIAEVLAGPGEAGPADGSEAVAALQLPSSDALTSALEDVSERRSVVQALKESDVGEIDALAQLLEAGLRHRQTHPTDDPADCPLCGAGGTIDEGWAVRTDALAQQLRARSRDLRAAEAALAGAERALSDVFPATVSLALRRAASSGELNDAAASWERWSAALQTDVPTDLDDIAHSGRELIGVLTELRDRAAEVLEARAGAWQPLLEAIAAWLVLARSAECDRAFVDQLKRGEAWMTETLTVLRRDRLAPIVDGARANWELLRHESNVTLGEVGLRKQGNQRYAEFDVTIDGTEASALGVMSQGEISALAICVFLPRALLTGSPFGFVVIDDPVQSMDPAKVDGLARVLAGAATERQVIVFTHDERLPEAIRRLDLPARIMRVQRRARSQLEIVAASRPSDRYMDEARALSKGKDLPPEVITRVIPAFCRSAIEAACAERIRRDRIDEGVSHANVDEQLAALTSLTTWLAAALKFSPSQGHEINAAVERLGGSGAVTAVRLARSGGHELIDGLDPESLVRDTRDLVRALEQR